MKLTNEQLHDYLVQLEPIKEDKGLAFDESTHTYTYNGVELKSVTKLLSEVGISPDYSSVDKELLTKSAEHGNLIHKEIEEWVKFGRLGISKEVRNFIDFLEEHSLHVLASEKIVHNDKLAGTIDLVLYNPVADKLIIADIKTTSTIHHDSVEWQLSLYNKLENYRYDEGIVIHFDSNGDLYAGSEDFKPKDTVEHLANTFTLPPLPVDKDTLELLKTSMQRYESAMQIVAECESFINGCKEKLINTCEKEGIKSYENDFLKITYVAPVVKQTFDTTRFKKEHPELASEYLKETTTKASVRITLRKHEKVEEESEEDE